MRLRRQHWCCLAVVILVIILCVAVGLPMASSDDGDDDDSEVGAQSGPDTPEARLMAVHALFDEVPLVDG